MSSEVGLRSEAGGGAGEGPTDVAGALATRSVGNVGASLASRVAREYGRGR